MTGPEAALWALLGGAVAEAVSLSAMMRPTSADQRWRWPWKQGERPLVLFAIALRLFIGVGLAAPLGASGECPTAFSAFIAGLAAPLLIARIFQSIPVETDPTLPTTPAPLVNGTQNPIPGIGPEVRSPDATS